MRAALASLLRRRPRWRPSWQLTAATAGVLLGAALVAGYSFPLGQVYLVEARTLGAVVTTEGHGNAWRLPPLVLCVPRPLPDPGAVTPPGAACDAVFFRDEHRIAEPVGVSLPAGMQIAIRGDRDGGLVLRAVAARKPAVLAGDAAWEKDGVILVAGADWERSGALRFEGRAEIGADMGSGEGAWLVEGRYQIRERLFRQRFSLGREAPVEVASGAFLRGDRIAFRCAACEDDAGGRVVAKGFVAPAENGAPGFLVTVASNPDLSRAEIAVSSFGAREVVLRPSWSDRATRDPVLVGLAAMVTFVGGLVGFAIQAAGRGD